MGGAYNCIDVASFIYSVKINAEMLKDVFYRRIHGQIFGFGIYYFFYGKLVGIQLKYQMWYLFFFMFTIFYHSSPEQEIIMGQLLVVNTKEMNRSAILPPFLSFCARELCIHA